MKVRSAKEKLRSTRKNSGQKSKNSGPKSKNSGPKYKNSGFGIFPYLTKFKKVHKKEACSRRLYTSSNDMVLHLRVVYTTVVVF